MVRALLAFLLAAGLCGCPVYSSAPCTTDVECPQGRCRLGGCGPMCQDDVDCPAGRTCRSGACEERAECASAQDCAQSFTCSEAEPRRCLCSSDAACAVNQVCRQGRCEESSRCTRDQDCPEDRRCEVTQGSCLPACSTAAACVPGLDPQLADLFFVCQGGACLRRCINDLTCGGQGIVCEAGLCERSECATFADCPSAQYCTSATAGRCMEYRECQERAECPENSECRVFATERCPPGFDCTLKICHELPRCLVDDDCQSTQGMAYCQRGHCQPTVTCGTGAACPPDQLCVASRCVPGGCRGHSDCPLGQACTDGACRSAPPASEVISVAVSPRSAVLVAGSSMQLALVAFTFTGESFPLAEGVFTVVGDSGAARDVATVTPSGLLTAAGQGVVTVQARVASPGLAPAEVRLTVLPDLGEGRRVTVVDATTGLPLSGVPVLGCDAPPVDAPCPHPMQVVTDTRGAALFPTFTQATASFSAASAELRGDGYPRYDRVSVAGTAARDVLLPLGDNPVHATTGFMAGFDFSQVHTSGPLELGFSLVSVGDPVDADLSTLLGDPFPLKVLQDAVPIYVPGSVVIHAELAGGDVWDIKNKGHGLGQPGRRVSIAFAGKQEPLQLPRFGASILLASTGAMDYALQAFTSMPLRPLVPDTCSDLDSDGRCESPHCCPAGPDDVPDYRYLPGFTHRPQREQLRRTLVELPKLGSDDDLAVVSAVQISSEAGIVPLGFSVVAAGEGGPSGGRPLNSVLLQSGAPYGGVETGTPGVWVFALQNTEARSDTKGWILRSPTLPLRVDVPGFLLKPLAQCVAERRALLLDSANWANLIRRGVSMGRVTFTGARRRHVVLFPLRASFSPVLRVPDAPQEAGEDPADLASAHAEVAALAFSAGVSPEEALDLPGPNLSGLMGFLEGYSRSRCWVGP